ncbi:MFS general substrate transporter [Dentipellis sp. KUC8613]|nr:MFS general substrate transporter [Dentipellis sp. KUC8613]
MEPEVNFEYKLPKRSSLVVVLLSNVLLQISFFIIVSSSSAYAEHLGGSATFSGLVIGIPTAFSGLSLIPLMKLDQGKYTRPLHFACGSMVLGSVLYALAYRCSFLYLILIGRMVQGLGFTFWMYSKRYCSDPRIVGIRRRTTLAGWLVLGQGVGMSLGPFAGGLLFRIGFSNSVFNGYTSPGWIMAGAWIAFWVAAAVWFEDVPPAPVSAPAIELQPVHPATEEKDKVDASASPSIAAVESSSSSTHSHTRLNARQWGVVACMCWFAMTCFFVLGAWESNLPVFGAATPALHWSPFASGNFIALGGIATFPFLLFNLFFARRLQDRHILALGSGLGLVGLVIAIAVLKTHAVNYGSIFVPWFLVALGFNLASTCTLSLLSKQLPDSWNGKTSLAIQYSNYTGRVTGAVWGGSGVKLGMLNYVGLEIAYLGVGALMFTTLWRELKAKAG